MFKWGMDAVKALASDRGARILHRDVQHLSLARMWKNLFLHSLTQQVVICGEGTADVFS